MKTITLDDGRTIVLDIDTISPEQGMMLAEAIAGMLVRSGRVRDDVAMTGPHLLQFISELADELAQEREVAENAEARPDAPGNATETAIAAGDLDGGAPNHTDHSRRGFDPR